MVVSGDDLGFGLGDGRLARLWWLGDGDSLCFGGKNGGFRVGLWPID